MQRRDAEGRALTKPVFMDPSDSCQLAIPTTISPTFPEVERRLQGRRGDRVH
jgi:hypothetical protein